MGRKNQESPWFLADAELSGEGEWGQEVCGDMMY